MANKLVLFCATLTLCFLLINASSYRTIVEFDEDDDTNPSNPSPQQKCQKEFQQEKHLQACQQWMRIKASLPEMDEFENPSPLILLQCCNELRQEDKVCVCPTLRQAAKAVDLQGEQTRSQTGKIYITAKNLPNICLIPRVGICSFKPPYY